MATFDWPVTFYPSAMEWGNMKAGLQFTSGYSGAVQSIEFPAERWLLSFSLPPRVWADAGAVEAFFERLSGGVNRVRLYHHTRPVPRGTLRGAPTVLTSTARGSLTLPLTAPTGATLKAGDLFKASGQLFKTAEDCAANGAGAITVPLVHRVRSLIPAGTLVTWDRPTAEFIMPAMGSKLGYSPGVADALNQIDFQEVW